MAKFNAKTADNYGGQGGGGFFSLKNDKDMATVRFMYESADDIEGFSVHEIELDGKKRYVNCLRDYDQPISECPLCEAKYRILAKIFVPLYDEETQEVKIWDRGKTFITKLTSLAARYNPMVSTPFEIERNGKKGDTSTTYETFALEADDITLEDLPELPEVLGGYVLDKTYEELDYYLDHGKFPEESEQTGRERNPAKDSRKQKESDNGIRRRSTPANDKRQEDADARPSRGISSRKRSSNNDEDRF